MVGRNKEGIHKVSGTQYIALFITVLFLAMTIAPVYAVSCQLASFSVDPLTASVGQTITITAGGSCDTGVRAIRVFVDGNIIYELGTTDITAAWVAAGEGTHNIRAEIAGQTDDNWTQSTSQSLDVTVTGSPPPPTCQLNAINVSPSEGNPGTVFTISASGSCDTGVRAIRIKINGNIIYELGSPDVSATWDSTGSSEGQYTATAEVAGQGDNDWNHLASASTQFTVGAGGQNPNPPTCTANLISVTPASGPSGTVFTISAKGSCTPPVRAIRVKINGNIIYELGSPEVTATWNSAGSPDAVYTATAEVAGEGDNNWSYAARIDKQFTVGNVAPPPAPPPNPPVCTVDKPVVSPPSGPLGTTFTITGNGSCNTGVRAIRIEVNGQIISELGAPSITATWNSAGVSDGVYRAVAVIAGQGDNDWGAAKINETLFAVGNATVPNEPVVTQPAPGGDTSGASSASTQIPSGCIHVVQSGQTLFRIGLNYGVTVQQLLIANPEIVNRDRIYPNQQIRIPLTTCPSRISPTPRPTSTATPTPEATQVVNWCPQRVHVYFDWSQFSLADPPLELRIPFGAWDENYEHLEFYYLNERVDNQVFGGKLIVDKTNHQHEGDYWVFGVLSRWAISVMFNPLNLLGLKPYQDWLSGVTSTYWWLDPNWSAKATC